MRQIHVNNFPSFVACLLLLNLGLLHGVWSSSITFGQSQHETGSPKSEFQFTVVIGDQERIDPFLQIELPPELAGDFPLSVEGNVSSEVLIQRDESSNSAWVQLLGRHPAGARYLLQIQQVDVAPPNRMSVDENEDLLTMKNRGRVLFQYHKSVVNPPAGIPAVYRRSGHIHPVYSPAGLIVTDEFPADHRHQHALFAAWVETSFRGKKVDFWNQHQGTGTVEHRRVLSTRSGPVFAEFVVELAAVDLTEPEAPQDVLIEQWRVRAFFAEDVNLFEIQTNQRCATSEPLILRDYHYGGMAIRGAADWTKDSDFKFLTSNGDGRETGNHIPVNWVNLSGSIGTAQAGITMFSSPRNEVAPQPVRLHPDFPYTVFTPVVGRERVISPEKPYSGTYLFCVHDGSVDLKRTEEVWLNFSQRVEVER